MRIHAADSLLQREPRRLRRCVVREEDALLEQHVARGVAVGKRDRYLQRDDRGDAGEHKGSPNAAVTAPRHLLQVDGCGLSIRRLVVGVPPGTMNVTMSLAAALVSFLTMNVFAPVSVHDCPGL